jgi:predicted nucleic acid-binding protein
MTTPPERWLLDTNIWVFGLRRDEAFPNCAQLLDRIGSFNVLIPLQVLKELNLNLTEDEISDFYNLINRQSEWVELSWSAAPGERVEFYEERGCRKGDAVIAAHAESLSVRIIVSENRQFLHTIKDLPLEIVNATEALARLPTIEEHDPRN